MTHFTCKTRIISGTGAVASLREMGIRKLLLVTDPFFMENGTAERIADMAKAGAVQIFNQVTPDPSVELAAGGAALVRDFDPDTVVALGGGSAMDCAKAMLYFGSDHAKLVAIPTTSGSGSEVTDFAILTHNGVKHPLVDKRLQPAVAILDSDLLTNLPRQLIADSGFDVLAHALEAWTATEADAFTDALAREAFCKVYNLLPASFNGNTTVRLDIHQASAMAGLAFTQAGLGLCHAMSHSLGGLFHVPHGRLNAILLPAVIDLNSKAAGSKYAALARVAGLGGSADTIAVRNLKNGLIRLRKELELPATLAQAGIAPARVYEKRKEIVAATLADPCCHTNAILVEEYMVQDMLTQVTGHG